MPTIELKGGQDLAQIAAQYKTSVPELLKMNPQLASPNFQANGGTLSIPDTAAAPTLDQSALGTGAGAFPKEKTFDGAGTGLPEKTLPDISTPRSPLLRFSSVLNDAVALARQKRAKFTESKYKETVPMGALPANSFATFLSGDESASTQFAKPLVDTAMTAFKDDEKTISDKREQIKSIAEKVASQTGNAKQVAKILAMTDPEEALIYATPLIKTKKESSGGGEGSSYSPEDLRQLRQAGLASNSDPAVKNFFLNSDPSFRSEFIRNYAKGVNQNVNITNIGQSFDQWSADQEAKKKNKNNTNSEIEDLFK